MNAAVVVGALRSPIGKGKPTGALVGIHPIDLLSQVLAALVEQTGVDPAEVEDVVTGCVSQVAEQSATPGRWAWLAAGLPEHVPSVTIDRRCGSSLQSLQFAYQAIAGGSQDVVVAAGVESMSRVPMGSNRQGADAFGGAARRYPPGLVSQGIAAELVAARWGLGRELLDEYSVTSHRRAAQARAAGAFDAEIVPIRSASGAVVLDQDETIREGSTVEALSGLRPAFENEVDKQRFPEIGWSITAGNSSPLADGASALLVVSERYAEKNGLTPMARIVGGVVTAEDPIQMLTAPIPATTKLLDRLGRELDDIDHVEVNEAFAPVPLAWAGSLDADPDRLNPRGGAIALGHPTGASGARLATTAVHAIGGSTKSALVTMCEAGGMANALLLEAL
ncbi:thiolase family protein [Actinomadura rugatobispora]|uniref:Thiolase family protein n=1 Tax=Actinomadura rugatobispora TaxID=1994 RepID=A0ABW0ZQ02_9ACTN